MRIAAIPAEVQLALDARRAAQKAERLAASEVWENLFDLVFTTERGQPIRPETYRRQFKALLSRAGLEGADLVPMNYRHSTGSYLEEAGVPIGTISDLVDHSDMTMVVKNYRHNTRSQVNGHLTAMDGVLAAN